MLNMVKCYKLAQYRDAVHKTAEMYGFHRYITEIGLQRHGAEGCNQPPRPPEEMPDEYAVRVQYKVAIGIEIECVWVKLKRGGTFVWSCFYDAPGQRVGEKHDQSWSTFFLNDRQLHDFRTALEAHENRSALRRLTKAGPDALPKMRTSE